MRSGIPSRATIQPSTPRNETGMIRSVATLISRSRSLSLGANSVGAGSIGRFSYSGGAPWANWMVALSATVLLKQPISMAALM